MPRPAIFLDRDGTLIEDRGDLSDPAQVEFIPGVVESLQKLGERFVFFIVTNQSGVGKGTIAVRDVERVNAHVVSTLRAGGIEIRDVYVCTHTSEDRCACRKPSPHFLERAEREHEIDLRASWAIGDHPCDVDLARNAGARGIYVLTGHGSRHRGDLRSAEIIAENLPAAIDFVAADEAARVLKSGGLVAFPTETVYGLGADAEQAAAVRRIYAVKGRPENHPLIVHIAGAEHLSAWTGAGTSALAQELAAEFWPGPLTMIVPRHERVPHAVTGGQETVGLRAPAHPLAIAMLRAHGGGVAAPSANRFGKVSPTTAAHVLEDLGTDVDLVLDGGACAVGIESTIVDLSKAVPEILRPGGVTREQLERAIGTSISVRAGASDVRAPGMLESHYAPNARVIVLAREELVRRASATSEKFAVIAGHVPSGVRARACFVLEAEAETLAHELYAALREADHRGAEVIFAELPPASGVGLALRDRLGKAAGGK